MPEKNNPDKVTGEVKTYFKNLSLCVPSMGGISSMVDVKDGKILRIRPLRYDAKYKPEEFGGIWKIEARGKVFEAQMKTLLAPPNFTYKKRIYSPSRIRYPMKRVDWDPNGERNPQNRGKSKYVRISWDEATDIIASEIKRIHKEYGPYGILTQADGHCEVKYVHAAHGCNTKLLALMGGYTAQIRNPDSWEGWVWGAKHVWGCEPLGRPSNANVIPDVAKHTDMVLFWGCDPETTPWTMAGQMPSRLCYWFKELGIKSIYVCPDLNYGAAVHADKWIPILPNTDAAMHLAIAYQWFTNETYDKKYLETHAIGWEKFADYVLGKEDGVPKTPKWASERCGVPSRIIKAFAKEWASKVTSITHMEGGGLIRGPYAHEPARLEVMLLAMQGLGKPGVHQFGIHDATYFDNTRSYPRPVIRPNALAAYQGWAFGDIQKQIIPKTLIHDAILNPPLTWWSSAEIATPVEDQLVEYEYPLEGCSKIHMIWTDSPCLQACWNDGHKVQEAYRHESIEFMLAQHPWLENDCLFADIILPINTKFEEYDLGDDVFGGSYFVFLLEEQCIESIGESKSDYEAVCAIAEKLGMLEEYTKGRSVEEWIKHGFDNSGVQDFIDWETFKEKGYWVVPTDPNWESYPAGFFPFYDDPEENPLTTPSGKLEFSSLNLEEYFPDDEERPPVPHWVPCGETHQESLECQRAKQYPLLVVSNHPRWRMHSQYDDNAWLREIPTCKITGPDGYKYEPIWINPADAAPREIKNGDVIKIYNERGAVLGGAYVTERIMPGVVYQDHGARVDLIKRGELDRGGSTNLISCHNTTSKHCPGMATSGYLVEVESVNIEEIRKEDPEAFERKYDKEFGLCFDAWIEEGGE